MKQKYIFFILFCTCMLGYGQSLTKYEDLIPKLIQSPNAASINKFIESPIDHFNGTTNVSFPLYEIKLKNLTIPIDLKYHNGGIRVNEEASWVGLGWALSVGGSITHQINGKDDDGNYPKYWQHYFPFQQGANEYAENLPGQAIKSPYLFNETGQQVYITQSFHDAYNLMDSEPDLYMYNMPDYSGKFIDSNYSNFVVDGMDLSNNSVKFSHYIKSSVSNDSIIAKAPNGCIYKFKDIETSIDVDGGTQTITNNTYMLSEILTSNKELIKFYYKSFKQIYVEKNWQSLYLGTGSYFQTDHFPNTPSITEDFTHYKPAVPNIIVGFESAFTVSSTRRTNNLVKQLYLTKIEFPDGSIEFVNEAREDMYGVKLARVIIKNNAGDKIKEFSFNFSYFIGNTPTGEDATTVPATTSLNVNYPTDYLKKRLKLVSFSELDNKTGTNELKYKFAYNESQLPYKSSFAQDMWGFYNAMPNKTLMPSYDLYAATFNIHPSFINQTGSNRNVNVNMVQAGVLKEVTYPTGGKTIFEYEPNESINFSNCYTSEETDRITASDPGSNNVSEQNQNIIDGIAINEFEIDQQSIVDIGVNLFRDSNIPTSSSNLYRTSYHFVSIEKKDPVNINDWIPYKDEYVWNTVNTNPTVLTIKDQILTPGKYRLVANYPNSYPTSLGSNMASISILKKRKIVECVNYVGGIRIKEIKHKESQFSQDLSTKYLYKNGILATIPSFSYFYVKPVSGGSTNTQADDTWVQVTETHLSATPVHSYSYSANGSIVGYQNVTEIKSDGQNGKTEYEYSMDSDPTIAGSSGIPGIRPSSNLKNGFLKSIKIYKNNDILQPVKSTSYIPYVINPKVYWAFKLDPGPIEFGGSVQDSNIIRDMYMQTYFYPITQGKTVIKEVSEYANGELINGVGTSLKTTTNYNYTIPTLYFPTSIEETRSDGGKNKKDILYSTQYNDIWNDLNGSQRGAYQDLVNQNRIIPIQESSYVNNEFISSSRINYKNWSFGSLNPLILPENIVTKNKGQNSYETQATFNVYDTGNGNVLETQKIAGIPVSYIWGYNKTLIVAKIENTSYSSISSSIISTTQTASNTGTEQELIAALKLLKDSLPNAMVTTYTHVPLVGVKTIIDPRGQTISYHYDSFNRLQYVTDHEGNVLSKNAYNYQNTTNP